MRLVHAVLSIWFALVLVSTAFAQDNALLSPKSYRGLLSPAEYRALLEDSKNDVAEADENGKTALHYAAELGNAPILKILVTAGADLEHTDKLGNSALHTAVLAAKQSNAIALQNLGVDVNVRNNDGETAIIVLMKRYDEIAKRAKGSAKLPGMIEALIEARPDLTIADNSGKTALDYAEFIGKGEFFTEVAASADVPLTEPAKPMQPKNSKPLGVEFEIKEFPDVAMKILSGKPFRFDEISQPVVGGVAYWFMENCRTAVGTADKIELLDFVKSVYLGTMGGVAYADPDLGKAISSQHAYLARFTAGIVGAQQFGCSRETTQILEYILESIRFNKRGTTAGGVSPFIESCSRRHGGAKCECLLSQGIAIEGSLANTVYTADTLKRLMEKNPFVVLGILAQCGISEY